MQVKAGARGPTVAKAVEGEVMADIDSDLLLPYPAADANRARRAAERARPCDVRVTVDTQLAIDALGAAAQSAESTIGILIDLDVGTNRTGVPTPERVLDLSRAAQQSSGLRLEGLFCYPGYIRTKPSKQGPALAEVDAMLRTTLDLSKRDGIEAQIVSGGSTPTARQSHLVRSCTEIRPLDLRIR